MKYRLFRLLTSFFVIVFFVSINPYQTYAIEFDVLKKSAEKGDACAQCNLGWMYHTGQGVPQDYQQAVYWYTKAAEQGSASAQCNLGVMYAKGQGVPQNYKYAYVWSNLAASKGLENAKHNRDLFAEKLTPKTLAEAQDLAAKNQYQIDDQEKR